MATRKTNKMTNRKNGRRVVSSRGAPMSKDVMKVVRSKYFVPGVTTAGAGIVAATGAIFRKELFAMARVFGKSFAKNLNVDGLLGFAGLERRNALVRTITPTIGGFALGIAAGSALSLLVFPKIRESLLEESGPMFKMGATSKRNAVGETPVSVE